MRVKANVKKSWHVTHLMRPKMAILCMTAGVVPSWDAVITTKTT